MPYTKKYPKRTYRRKTTRKTYAKKKRFNKYRITVGRQLTPLVSDKQFMKLKVTYNYLQSHDATTYDAVSYPGNGFASSGDFPAGMATWACFYSKYRILGSTMSCSAVNNDSANPIILGILCRDSEDNYGLNANNVFEQANCRYKQLAASGGQNKAFLKMFMKTKKMQGERVSSGEEFCGSFSYTSGTNTISNVTNPAQQWIWEIFTASPISITNDDISILATITYYVVFEDRRSQSTTTNPIAAPD